MTFGPPVLTFAPAPIRHLTVYLSRVHYLLGAMCCRGRTEGTVGAGGVQMERVVIAACRPGGGAYRVYPCGSRRVLAGSAVAMELGDGPADKNKTRREAGT